MPSLPDQIPTLRRPAVINAAEYWLRPEALAARCQKLGDRFLMPMPGTGPWLCLTHPDDIKRVFSADTEVLRLGEALKLLAPHELFLGPTGLTNVDGADHLRRRRLLNPPFHGAALQSYEQKIEHIAEESVDGWPRGRPEKALPRMQTLALEVILAIVFGVRDHDRLRRLRKATLALMAEGHSTRFTLQTMLATARRDGWNRSFPRVRAAVAAVDAIVLEEVRSRRSGREEDSDDVLGLLLIARDEDGAPMSEPEICDAMRTLLIGGHETTASTLAWALERIARHPVVLSRLEHAALDRDDEYIDAVVKETMRLRPVFPMTARLAHDDWDLGGLTVPAGTVIIPYITLVHRRADLYTEPLEFRPERFLDTRAGTYSWIPFGGGPRRCIGAALSLVEAGIVLRTIFRGCRIQPTTARSERVGRQSVTIVPGRGATVTLHRRAPAQRSEDGRSRQADPRLASVLTR